MFTKIKTRQDLLEEAFLKHMDKEESSFQRLIETLDTIKDELHKTNTQMSEFNASHTLNLLETKAEILETVFNKTVKKDEFDKELSDVKQDIETVSKDLSLKVDKSSVKLLWMFVTTAAAAAGDRKESPR